MCVGARLFQKYGFFSQKFYIGPRLSRTTAASSYVPREDAREDTRHSLRVRKNASKTGEKRSYTRTSCFLSVNTQWL